MENEVERAAIQRQLETLTLQRREAIHALRQRLAGFQASTDECRARLELEEILLQVETKALTDRLLACGGMPGQGGLFNAGDAEEAVASAIEDSQSSVPAPEPVAPNYRALFTRQGRPMKITEDLVLFCEAVADGRCMTKEDAARFAKQHGRPMTAYQAFKRLETLCAHGIYVRVGARNNLRVYRKGGAKRGDKVREAPIRRLQCLGDGTKLRVAVREAVQAIADTLGERASLDITDELQRVVDIIHKQHGASTSSQQMTPRAVRLVLYATTRKPPHFVWGCLHRITGGKGSRSRFIVINSSIARQYSPTPVRQENIDDHAASSIRGPRDLGRRPGV